MGGFYGSEDSAWTQEYTYCMMSSSYDMICFLHTGLTIIT